MHLFDSHCHLTFREFDADREAVLARAKEAGVLQCLCVGTDPEQVAAVIALADHQTCFAAVGFHPSTADGMTDENLRQLAEIIERHRDRIVAIGETGLDFYRDYAAKSAQRALFIHHLKLAHTFQLPLIVHSRSAVSACLAILASHAGPDQRAVFHCFTGTDAEADEILARGFSLSFAGQITYPKNDALRETVKRVPMDRLLLETDSPFLSPKAVRKIRRNEPAHLAHTARFLADLRSVPLEDLAQRTTENTQNLFLS